VRDPRDHGRLNREHRFISGAREGDRVVADALCQHCTEARMLFQSEKSAAEEDALRGSHSAAMNRGATRQVSVFAAHIRRITLTGASPTREKGNYGRRTESVLR
jgi:hypothetical protein